MKVHCVPRAEMNSPRVSKSYRLHQSSLSRTVATKTGEIGQVASWLLILFKIPAGGVLACRADPATGRSDILPSNGALR
jgi:hypothetical protein